MKVKKTPKADLENRRGMYLEIGMVLILVAALASFNVRPYSQAAEADDLHDANSQIDIIFIDPPSPEPVEEAVTNVKVAANDAGLTHEAGIVNAGDNMDEAQTIEVVKGKVVADENAVALSLDEDPEFPGGQRALSELLAANIKYPQQAKERGIEGLVCVAIVAEKEGSIGYTKVPVGIGCGCGAEAERVVGTMPEWKPGTLSGRSVRTTLNLPVAFRLD